MPPMAPVELDFLGLRPAAAAADHHHGSTTGGTTTTTTSSSSIRGMKTSAIASIGAQQLRRVIVGDDAPPKQQQAPMTVFYNGAVATFDGVSQDKAEAIMRMAMEVNGGRRVGRGDAFAGNLTKDMPLTRTKSLQQFLQKRKESWVGSVSAGIRNQPRWCSGDQQVVPCEGGSSGVGYTGYHGVRYSSR